MKYINITYLMDTGGEVAERNITLPMIDDIADDILWMKEDSTYLGAGHDGAVRRLLESLSAIQGYKYIGTRCLELVSRAYKGGKNGGTKEKDDPQRAANSLD